MALIKWLGLPALCMAATVCIACGHNADLRGREVTDSGADASESMASFTVDGSSFALGIVGGVVYDVVVDSQGNFLLLGTSSGDVKLTPEVTLAAAVAGVFIAKFDTNGKFIWGRSFTANDALRCSDMALTPDDDVVLGCTALAASTVLGQELPPPNERDAVLIKFGSDGTLEWLRMLGGDHWQQATRVGVGSDGSIYATGVTNGTIDFGGGPRPVTGNFDVFFAKFDANGTHVSSQVFGDANDQSANSIAVAPNGDVLLAGTFEGQIDFGSGPLVAWGFDAVNFFIARFDSNGVPLWNRRIVSTSYVPDVHVALMPSGGMVLCGTYQGTIQFSNASDADAGNTSRSDDGFLALLDPTGQVTASRVFGANWLDACRDVAVTAHGDFVITGDFGDIINLGGSDLGIMGEFGSLYGRYDNQGNPLQSKALLSNGWTVGTAIAPMPAGRVALAGYLLQREPLDIGFAQLQNIDSYVVVMPE